MHEEKARLERAAMRMFIRALQQQEQRELRIVEQRERPDFSATDIQGNAVGVEITHLYHNEEEARYLNGVEPPHFHPLTTTDELLDALNRSLEIKAELSYGYESFERLILLIRVTSPYVRKERIVENLDCIRLPDSAFDEVWMLFYDYDHLDWADLLRLDHCR